MRSNSAKTVSAAQFLGAAGTRLLVGPTWSFQVSAAKSYLAQSGAISIVPGGSSEIAGGGHPNVFHLSPHRQIQAPLLSAWLKERHATRVCLFVPFGDWGEVHREVFRQSVVDAGGEVVDEARFDYGVDASTINSLMLRCRRKNPDALFMTSAAKEAALIVRTRNQLHLPFLILGTDTVADAISQKLLSENEMVNLFFIEVSHAQGDFASRFANRFGVPSTVYSERGYDAVMIYHEAYRAVGPDPQAIARHFREKLDYTGVSGRVRFDKEGNVQDGSYRIVSAQGENHS